MEQKAFAVTDKGNKFSIPVVMGIIIAIVKIILSAIQYKYFLESYRASMVLFISSFLIGAILLFVTGRMQKKKFGNTITIKEAFQAVFIAILIVVVSNFIFDQVYMKLDPGMSERIYHGKVALAKTTPNSAQKIKELTEEYQEELKQPVSIGNMLAGLLNSIIKYSILGIIFALALGRNKPTTA